MNKKLIGSVVALAAVVVVVLAANRRHGEAPVAPTPRVVAEAPVGAKAPAQASSATSDPEEAEGYVTQSLKGKDFNLQVTVNGNPSYRNLEVSMADGRPILLERSLGGQIGKLADTTFAPSDEFELKQLIPGDVREQIVCHGNQYLTQGEGKFGAYAIYRIEGDRLQTLLELITERDREEGNGPSSQKLKATVEETTSDGLPAIIYRVKVEQQPERTIVFRWNGKIFEDASGEYAKIESEYNP
ncbi:hypothetical protein D0T25_11180 [Duganella sp. BJB488]|nr:hypothetical protein D0T26_11220 [Duganella sp. BJB489]RFP23594.1 hypothetical protein D0T25_11180 [Duganella sp. BJB488]RFP38760.1 hypothetical protein D0T24_04025 [Duganella sp. BJB480]